VNCKPSARNDPAPDTPQCPGMRAVGTPLLARTHRIGLWVARTRSTVPIVSAVGGTGPVVCGLSTGETP
jgi:hypothetical protein